MGLNEALKLNPPVPAGNAMAQCAVADLTKQDAANMPPDDFLGQYFRGIRNTGPDQWVALCPAHGDKNPSLSITRGEDRYLFYCHAGCAYEEIVEKAGARQSEFFFNSDGINQQSSAGTGAIDSFAAMRGHDPEVYSRLRCKLEYVRNVAEIHFPMLDDHGRHTGWRRRRADGVPFGGGRKCMTCKGGRNGLLYDPFSVRDAGIFLIVEGEMDAAAAMSADYELAVVGTPGATPGKQCLEYLSKIAASSKVYLAPDPDQAGDKWCNKIGEVLLDANCEVYVVQPSGTDLDERLKGGEKLSELISGALSRDEYEATSSDRIHTTPKDLQSDLWRIENKGGSTKDEKRREQACEVVKWLQSRGEFYLRSDRRDFTGVMFFDRERKVLMPVQSDAFLAWLSETTAINRVERPFQFIAKACETEGLSERSTAIEPASYWASRDDAAYISNGQGSMVRISVDGVDEVDNGTDGILFDADKTLKPWEIVEPEDPFKICKVFRDVSAAAGHGSLLFKLWGISLALDQPTKPPLVASGPVGSGKTKLLRSLAELYGLPPSVSKVAENGESDFWTAMENGGIHILDNADSKNSWIAEAIAAASTGAARKKRKLYTDAEHVMLRPRAWCGITTANPTFASDAGLADRLLVVRMNRRRGETAEKVLSDEIKRHRDAGLTWIAYTLSNAMGMTVNTPVNLNARHPDFAEMGVAIGRALGQEQESIAALTAAEEDKSLYNIENDWIGSVLYEMLQGTGFEGSAKELDNQLKLIDSGLQDKLGTRRLSKHLARLWPHLEKVCNAQKHRGHANLFVYKFEKIQQIRVRNG